MGINYFRSIRFSTKSTIIMILIFFSFTGSIYHQKVYADWISLGGSSKYIATGNDSNGNLVLFSIGSNSNAVYKQQIYIENLLWVTDERLRFELITDRLSFPTSMAFIDEEKILVLQKYDAQVRLISNGILLDEPVLKVSTNSIGERGLLGIAVNRDSYGTEVFLYFTEALAGGETRNRIYKYTWNESTLTLSDPRLIIDLPAEFVNHNGGKLVIHDQKLFAVIGDQNRDTLPQNIGAIGPEFDGSEFDTGVILRTTLSGLPLEDNPFYDRNNDSILNSVFAYGIRNSFGLAIDPVTGYLWDTENGDTEYDEINIVLPGFNSGWKKVMGPISRSNTTLNDLVHLPGSQYYDPVFSWYRTVAPTSLTFMSSTALGPQYLNNLFVGDFNNGYIYRFILNETRTGFQFSMDQRGLLDLVADPEDERELSSIIFARTPTGITDLVVGPDGYLYVLTFGGSLYRIVPTNSTSTGSISSISITNTSDTNTESSILYIRIIIILILIIVAIVSILVIRSYKRRSLSLREHS